MHLYHSIFIYNRALIFLFVRIAQYSDFTSNQAGQNKILRFNLWYADIEFAVSGVITFLRFYILQRSHFQEISDL